MKLSVRMIDTVRGTIPVLCDDDGKALPGQVASSATWDVKEVPKVTVTFIVDGRDVEFSAEEGRL